MEENYLMHYDNEGYIKGFYLKSIHGDNIPRPVIEITPEKHNFYLENQGLYKINPLTLEDEAIPEPPPQPYEPSLEERNRADIDYIAIMAGVDL
jgi:hypothetical protein